MVFTNSFRRIYDRMRTLYKDSFLEGCHTIDMGFLEVFYSRRKKNFSSLFAFRDMNEKIIRKIFYTG